MSSSVQPAKTKSLESSKCKRKSSEQVSDAELQAASSLAQMMTSAFKKAVKKIVSSEVRRVTSAFDDDLFVESSQKDYVRYTSQKAFGLRPLLKKTIYEDIYFRIYSCPCD
jgi:hypothetical protein